MFTFLRRRPSPTPPPPPPSPPSSPPPPPPLPVFQPLHVNTNRALQGLPHVPEVIVNIEDSTAVTDVAGSTETAAAVTEATTKALQSILEESRLELDNFAEVRFTTFQLFVALGGFTAVELHKQLIEESLLIYLGLAVLLLHIIWLLRLLMQDRGKECILKNVITMLFNAVIVSLLAALFGINYLGGSIVIWVLIFILILFKRGGQIWEALNSPPRTIVRSNENAATAALLSVLRQSPLALNDNFAEVRFVMFQMFVVLGSFITVTLKKQVTDYLTEEKKFSLFIFLGLSMVFLHIFWLLCLLMEDRGRNCILDNLTAIVFTAIITVLFGTHFGIEYYRGMALFWFLTFGVILYKKGSQIWKAIENPEDKME